MGSEELLNTISMERGPDSNSAPALSILYKAEWPPDS